MTIRIYDCTLREGIQKVGLRFNIWDKMEIIKRSIGDLGIHFVEAGYPFSSGEQMAVFNKLAAETPELMSQIVAFGATHKNGVEPELDPNLLAIVGSGATNACIFGKSWDYHLQFVKATREENLSMIENSVDFLVKKGFKVFFDAEHFFSGYQANPEFAMEVLGAAIDGGATNLSLCDTNGGTLPFEIVEITSDVIDRFPNIELGLHAHNDSGTADANALEFARLCESRGRDSLIQATFGGFGERCGNTVISTILPLLNLKLGYEVVTPDQLRNLTNVAYYVDQLSNLNSLDNYPFIGHNAFAHKGGMHIAAVSHGGTTNSYEHIDPLLVGNHRNIVLSEVSGKAAVRHSMKKFDIEVPEDDSFVSRVVSVIKEKERKGQTYEGAPASLEILIRSLMQDPDNQAYYRTGYFEVERFRVITEVHSVFSDSPIVLADANLKVTIENDQQEQEVYVTAAEGNGPVNAIDNALRRSLVHFYPVLKDLELVDYKVRIVTGVDQDEEGTAARVSTLVVSTDSTGKVWNTIGTNENIIVASFLALLDSYVYKLVKAGVKPHHSKIKIKPIIIE